MEIVQSFNVSAIIDVRGIPYSKHAPQFNQNSLQEYCNLYCIKYFHMPQLNGVDTNINHTPSHVITENLKKIVSLHEKYNLALLGANNDVTQCHRYKLCNWLIKYHNIKEINHIELKTKSLFKHVIFEEQIPLL